MVGESTTIWRYRTRRWELRVDQWIEGDRVWCEANLIGIVQPLHRHRHMPVSVFQVLTQAIERAVGAVNDPEFKTAIEEQRHEIACFERWQVMTVEHALFIVTVHAVRMDDDSVRYVLSIYDRDDPHLPVLSLYQGDQAEFLAALWEAGRVISANARQPRMQLIV